MDPKKDISEADSKDSFDLGSRSRRRWYDQEPVCNRLIHILREVTHPELREAMARLIQHLVDKVGITIRGGQNRSAPVSLGLPALQDLYSAKHTGRRWYDDEPTLKKAVSGLYTLPGYGLTAVCFQLINTFDLLLIYAFACERLRQKPTRQDVKDIIQVSLYEGRLEGQELLAEIVGQDLLSALTEEIQGL